MSVPILIIILINDCHCQSNAETNVAYGKMALNSSANGDFDGFLTIDGQMEPPFCFSSLSSGYQWLQIDLIWVYRVDVVQIVEKLLANIFSVRLTTASTSTTIASCYNLTSQLDNTNVSFQCPNAAEYSSRYLTIDQSSISAQVINICEVVVLGQYADALPERKNLLLLRNAYAQNSYLVVNSLTNASVNLVAAFAVDGIRDTLLLHTHCSHTNEYGSVNNWILVDMGRNYQVDYIAFATRYTTANLVVNRSANFIIGLTSFNVSVSKPVRGLYPLCNRYPGRVPLATRAILQCNPNLPAYRYIIAQQAVGAGDGYFASCELEAYEPLMTNSIKQLKWKSYMNQRLVNYTFLAFPAARSILCIQKCVQSSNYTCDSLNFNPQLMICELNQHRNGFLVTNMKFNLTWNFWNATYYYVGNI